MPSSSLQYLYFRPASSSLSDFHLLTVNGEPVVSVKHHGWMNLLYIPNGIVSIPINKGDEVYPDYPEGEEG